VSALFRSSRRHFQLNLRRDLGTDMVQLFVGSNRKLFSVYKKPLCSASEFFDKAFNGPFAEASSNRMDLPEDTPETFSMFVAWLYNRKRDLYSDLEHCDTISGTDELIKLYASADAKRCNALKNIVMDTLQDGLRNYLLILRTSHIQQVFENTCTTAEAPIRKFCVASIAHGLVHDYYDVKETSDLFESCPDAMREYLKFVADHWGRRGHEHDPALRGAGELYTL
jgi:hypothetical protein